MTGIQWTDATWNPTIGCSRVSEGCRHCYAETMANRLSSMSGKVGERYREVVTDGRWNGRVVLDKDALLKPLSWKKPRRVFVNSMSDLFHENLSNEDIAAVFAVMAACPQHQFQCLTKRPKRMREWFEWVAKAHADMICWGWNYNRRRLGIEGDPLPSFNWQWPLKCVHLGISAEDQATFDARLPDLLATPAAIRFVSFEPLLGPIRLPDPCHIDWGIVGCESRAGKLVGRLSLVPELDSPGQWTTWLYDLRGDMRELGIAPFIKQVPRAGKVIDGAAAGWPQEFPR